MGMAVNLPTLSSSLVGENVNGIGLIAFALIYFIHSHFEKE